MNSINKHFAFLLMGAVLTILSATPAHPSPPGAISSPCPELQTYGGQQ